MAAVFACGPGAVLSHRSAAELWELLKPRLGPIDVAVATPGGRARRKGLRIHRFPSLPNTATTYHDGISVTTPARTLTDLATVAPAWELRKATRQAEFLGLPTPTVTDRTRSDLERAFLRLCRRHRLPPPEVNVKIGPFTVDFLWRDQRLVVETDGYAAHRGRQAFLDDRARELELGRLGLHLRRFSDDQIAHRPSDVAAAIRAELAP
jgi:very-short-patch-repair endonuclease